MNRVLLFLLLVPFVHAESLILSEAAPAFYVEPKQHPSWVYMPYDQYDLDAHPYVNESKLARAGERFHELINIQQNNGYNGLVIGDAERFVTTGFPEGSKEYQRAITYRSFFNNFTNEGMKLYAATDFQPLSSTLRKQIKPFKATNPTLQAYNKEFFEELFTEMPALAGVVLRIGEGGKQYATNPEYASEVMYRTPEDLHVLLDAILPVFQKHNRTLIFRVWSVGLGELGDLSVNPELYEEVFEKYYDEPNLVISIKYGSGDFWHFLQPNPLLGRGELPQIIEFQLRREYEGYGLLTNSLGAHYGAIVMDNQKNNPNFAGMYNWVLIGGWDTSYNLPFFTDAGFWTEVDNALLPKFMQGTPDVTQLLNTTITTSFDETLTGPLIPFISDSMDIMKEIYYIESFATQNLSLRGLSLPKPMWVFWDTPVSNHFGLIHVVKHTDNLQEEIDKTQGAYDRFRAHKDRILEKTTSNSFLGKSLAYQNDVLFILVSYKKAFLNYYHYIETGEQEAFLESKETVSVLKEAVTNFERTYQDNPVLTVLNFNDMKGFMNTVESLPERRLASVIATSGFLLLVLLSLFHWRKRDDPAIKGCIALFFALCILSGMALAGVTNGIIVGIIFGCFCLLIVFINQTGYAIVRVLQKEHARSILSNITSISALIMLVLMVGTQFIPERIWLRLYELLFLPGTKYALIIIFLYGFYYAWKLGLMRIQLKLSAGTAAKIILVDVLTMVFVMCIIWELFILFFPHINEILNLFPSILSSTGVGEELVKQYSFFR